jgi:hypothetical protein
MRALRVLCSALACAAFLAPCARADEHDKLTYFTFSGPVQIPGHTLAAGTYMFKLADSPSNRHIVQVFNKDGSKLYATILAIPDQRLDAADKPVVLFRETPAGTPGAVRAWFYPGNTIGDEFVYPKEQAIRIAKATHEPVLSMTDESNMKNAEVTRVDENGLAIDQNKTASATSTAPATTSTAPAGTSGSAAPSATDQTSRPARVAPVTTPPSSSTANSNAGAAGDTTAAAAPRRARQLPRTGSPLALYELMSGLAFAGAFGLRRLRHTL